MPRTIKRRYRDVLQPALVLDSANTATALGEALMGADIATGRILRERLEAELLLLDCLAWEPNDACDLFTLTLPDEQLARAARAAASRRRRAGHRVQRA